MERAVDMEYIRLAPELDMRSRTVEVSWILTSSMDTNTCFVALLGGWKCMTLMMKGAQG
jgi:hypothetical protein